MSLPSGHLPANLPGVALTWRADGQIIESNLCAKWAAIREWEGKSRMPFQRNEGGNLGVIVHKVVLIGQKEPSIDPSRIDPWQTQRNTGIEIEEGDSFRPSRIGIAEESVRVQPRIAIILIKFTVEPRRPLAEPQIDPSSGGPSILGRELAGDHLQLLYPGQNRHQSLTPLAVVIVVKTLNRQIVRIGSATGK